MTAAMKSLLVTFRYQQQKDAVRLKILLTLGHHRKSGVDPAWKTEFRWLEFVRQDEQVGLLCKICAKYNKTPRNGRGSWTKVPCFTLRKDKIKRHENSRMHKAAISLEADRAGGGIAQAFSGLITCEMKAAVGCCKCIYWLCKNEIPHTTVYPNLLELAEQLGCEYFKALKVGRNATYTSPQIVEEFIGVINNIIETNTLNVFKESAYFSLMADETTDVSILKQLVLYGRAVEKGKLKSSFLKMIDLEDGKANTITNAIVSYLESADLDIKRMSSFGSDGASVMIGCRTGVATQLLGHNEQMMSVHCICHRLALASGQASTDVPYLKKMKDTLLALWKFFHYSPVRSFHLKQVQAVMNSPELKITKAVDTRWLSHKAVITTILRSLPAILVTLQQLDEPTAVGLYKCMAKYNFFASLLLLDEVLSAVNRLSLAFQRSGIDLTTVSPLLMVLIMNLEKLKSQPADDFKLKVTQLIDKTTREGIELQQSEPETDSTEESEDDNEPSELVITISDKEPEKYERNVRQNFLSKVIDNLRDRFPKVNVLEAFSVFDPSGLLGESNPEEHLATLLDHYKEEGPMGIDKAKCITEYKEFTSFIQDHAKLKHCRTLQELAEETLSKESIAMLFPLVSKLLNHALVLPVSTTDCERCFSTMKRVKTDLRNRMSTQTLDRLIRIRTEGPDMAEFDFNQAVKNWSSLKNRRLFN